ncbi:pantoate--beta-alanine ligase [Roseibium polysiphoniae]|uniref:pantoate--beta-alanine ligase n=1 Tax=Roseibium polysiphoniae TaxID=2571221 RepID=UPI003298083C
MKICTTKKAIREEVREAGRKGLSVALVPTMGFLHEGHLSLVREAASQADRVVVSIFVNPTQFGPNEDLSSYPRDAERDLKLLQDEGVAAVFMPDVDEMYGVSGDTFVEVPGLSGILQGALRPGHFRGVATVVTKLFNIVGPDVAVFGEKDYQQLALIRQMVRDLDMPLKIVGHPTVREADGLAMSSRNVRLELEQRAEALALNRSLLAADDVARAGGTIADMDEAVRTVLSEASLGKVESVDIRDAETLEELEGVLTQPAVVLLAVRFGKVLLIDQKVIHPGTKG